MHVEGCSGRRCYGRAQLTMLDVQTRLIQLQEQRPELRLYALADGLQFEQHHGERLSDAYGRRGLFAGTPDAPLIHAGPWLFDMVLAGDLLPILAELEQLAPAVSWLIAPQDLDGLAMLLQLRLDMQLPDGRLALLRFWDPRVLAGIAGIMRDDQRAEFFAHIDEWHLLHQGKRVWIGRHYADA